MMQRGRFVLISAAVVGVALAAPGVAEVRLRMSARTATVDVIPTSRGPWTPHGSIDSLVLNPGGDILGDGFPSWSSSGPRVLASWVRADGSVVAAVGQGAWSVPIVIEASSATGSPVVASLAGGWAVAWQVDGDPGVRLASATAAGGLGATFDVSSGWLVGVGQVGASSVTVATVSVTGDLAITTVVFGSTPAPEPILIPAVRGPVVVETLAFDFTSSLEPEPILNPARNHGDDATPDIRLHSGSRHGAPYALVTWWVSPSELHWIELTEDGPAFPVEVLHAPGNADHSQSLVHQAVNEVRGR